MISELRRREKSAYPAFMRQMQACWSMEDLQDYCESDHVEFHLLGDNGYIILTEDEVVDWVGGGIHSLKALGIIKRAFGTSPFTVDLRETTSWPIMKALEARGSLTITKVSPWDWDGETMYEATIRMRR